MGKASRDKGARGERMLVKELQDKYELPALRVPLSGAMRGYDCDVVVDGNPNLTFELKFWKQGFENVYALFESSKKDVLRFFCDGVAVEMSLNLSLLLNTSKAFPDSDSKVHRKIINMRKLLSGANFLVIKSDRKPFLFLRFL